MRGQVLRDEINKIIAEIEVDNGRLKQLIEKLCPEGWKTNLWEILTEMYRGSA